MTSDQKDSALDKYRSSFLEADDDFHLLNSNLFGKLFCQELMSTQAAFIVLPRILWKIQLRRVMGMKMDLGNGKEPIVIEEQIPGFTIKIIEVPMTPMQLARYAAVH